jgi:predicted membrane protein
MAFATITDVGFLGLIPKALLQILYRYSKEINPSKLNNAVFLSLINTLVSAFIYQPIYYAKGHSYPD